MPINWKLLTVFVAVLGALIFVLFPREVPWYLTSTNKCANDAKTSLHDSFRGWPYLSKVTEKNNCTQKTFTESWSANTLFDATVGAVGGILISLTARQILTRTSKNSHNPKK